MSADPFFPEAPPATPEVEERLRALPKVELHQHVDGSIPAEVTWELMRLYRLHPADSLPEMRRDRKSTRLNSSHVSLSRMPSSA